MTNRRAKIKKIRGSSFSGLHFRVLVFGSSFSKMNKEAKIKKIRGSSFSGLSFWVFVFEDEQRGKNKENKGVLVFGS